MERQHEVREGEETRKDWDLVQENQNSNTPEVGDRTERLKIVGGHLYRTMTSKGVALCFVPGRD